MDVGKPIDSGKFLRQMGQDGGYSLKPAVNLYVQKLVKYLTPTYANTGIGTASFYRAGNFGTARDVPKYEAKRPSYGISERKYEEALKLMSDGAIDPSFMISHIGGLNAGVETILNLPNIPGSKKLLYTHIKMPLTAIDDFDSNNIRINPISLGILNLTKPNFPLAIASGVAQFFQTKMIHLMKKMTNKIWPIGKPCL
jgi:hypothetical protein